MKDAKNLQIDIVERPEYRNTCYQARCTSVDEPMVSRGESIAQLEAQVMARSDGEDRIARVEMLKLQIEAGTYSLDSNTLAQTMQEIPFVCAILGVGANDIFVEEVEETDV